MRSVSQRCQYALRAIYELACNMDQGPLPTTAIARSQAIPHRYLEQILSELRRQGVVRSFRGVRGGYELAHDPDEVSVGSIMRIFERRHQLVSCQACGGNRHCALQADCAFAELWRLGDQRLDDLFDKTTFADLAAAAAPECPERREEALIGVG